MPLGEFLKGLLLAVGYASLYVGPINYGLKLVENKSVYESYFRDIPKEEKIITVLPPLLDRLYYSTINRSKLDGSDKIMYRW